jgi:DNA-binding transcriptional LysR family regulator
MDLIASLRSFLRVAETGSFSAVAAERGVTQPAISRQVSALEEHLGTRLVQRSTQAVTLTEEGRHFMAAAKEMVDAADAMMQSAAHRRGKPVGVVRLSAHVSFGLYISRHLPKLLGKHDELSVELVVRDRCGGLIEEGLDLEVRFGRPEDPALITRRIGYANALVVASHDYLANRPIPLHPSELSQHECIIHHGPGASDVWWFREGEARSENDDFTIPLNVSGRFSSNNSSTVYNSVVGGQGVGSLAYFLVADDIRTGRLVHLMPNYRRRGWPIFVTYPTRRSLPPRTRAVIDFLIKILHEVPGMQFTALPSAPASATASLPPQQSENTTTA